MPGSNFAITPPTDYLLHRDGCSYGYFLLHPNRWDVERQQLERTFLLPGGACLVVIRQARARTSDVPEPGNPLRIKTDRPTDADDRAELRRQIVRMLRLDEPAETIAAFHKLDKRWKRSGRGRLVRSPTFFEDVIKTVTSCNVTWPSTVHMNRRLCEVLGDPSPTGLRAFPSAQKIARTRPASLRGRCRVGYRDERIVQIAKRFAAGERGSKRTPGAIDAAWFENPRTPDDEVYEALLNLPGIGPYAAANIMQLLGRYARLPLDTESVRHGKTVLGMTGSPTSIMKRLHDHYAPFAEHAFRSYWFELWAFYEQKRGPAHTWDRDTTGSTFTASQFAAEKV